MDKAKLVPRPSDVIWARIRTLHLHAASGELSLGHVSAAIDELTDAAIELEAARSELRAQNESLLQFRESVRAERHRYLDLFEFAPDGYLVTDLSSSIRECNREAGHLLNMSCERLIGRPLRCLVAKPDQEAFSDMLAQLTMQAEVDRIARWELRLQPHGKPALDAALTVGIMYSTAAKREGLRWLIRDISRAKRAEADLRTERDFAESLIRTAEAAVLLLDGAGRIVRSNPFAAHLTGEDAAALIGRDWLNLFVPEDQEHARHWLKGVNGGAAGNSLIQAVQGPAGRRRVVSWSARALPKVQDGGEGLLIIGHDITTLQEAQQRALQVERLAAIGEMMAGLAHESRNALQRSQACLEMLVREVADRPRACDLVTRVQSAQDHLHHLYEEVRHFAAPVPVERQPCDVRAIWRLAWARLERQSEKRQVMLCEEVDEIDLQCLAAPGRLEQVFRNILDNALAACSDPVVIDISCRTIHEAGRAWLQVTVRDNGPGLTAEQQQKMFEPFYTTKIHGTGLGLAIVRRIVEAHGGRVQAATHEGPGAEIVVTLPRRTP